MQPEHELKAYEDPTPGTLIDKVPATVTAETTLRKEVKRLLSELEEDESRAGSNKKGLRSDFTSPRETLQISNSVGNPLPYKD